jgi:hypothetical protein
MVSSSTVSGEGAYLLADARGAASGGFRPGPRALLGITPEAWVGAAWSPEECLRGRELAAGARKRFAGGETSRVMTCL